MAKAVFYHKADSVYDDRPEAYYNFPNRYLSRVEQAVNDYIVYYGPIDKIRGYNAVGRVVNIREDEQKKDHYYADIDEYVEFDRFVKYDENGGYEEKLFLPDGRVNGGHAVNAIRLIEDREFSAILNAGLSDLPDWPDRFDGQLESEGVLGFGEEPQAEFERQTIQMISNKKVRDRRFMQHIRKFYNRTCAFTGLRLINGKGRPEVEAAHIMPVEENGPDTVRNGIALSGTVHWMFDRGLLSLSDSFEILISRQINYDVTGLLHEDLIAKVPSDPRLQPHPYYLSWHRENRFKA